MTNKPTVFAAAFLSHPAISLDKPKVVPPDGDPDQRIDDTANYQAEKVRGLSGEETEEGKVDEEVCRQSAKGE